MSDDIILKFIDANILINDKAYERIKSQENSLKFAESLIQDLTCLKKDVVVLTEEILDQYLKEPNPHITGEDKDSGPDIDINSDFNHDLDINVDIVSDSTPKSQELDPELKTHQHKFSSGMPFDFHVIQDTSKKSYTNGEIKDFSAYFNSRFHKLRDILNKRNELKDHRPIKDIGRSEDVIKVIGMVNDIKNTKNSHKILELEDETGTMTVLVHNENHKLFEKAERIVKDEVIGIVGSRKGNFAISSELVHPGVPRIDEKPMDFSAVFISDVHIGSATFLEDTFLKFIKWINGDFGDKSQIEIAQNVKYLVVAGDVVDGIGIYPNQEKELTITDIYKQYEEAARLFGEINDIKIIIAPGNHDASRMAEPQPAIPQQYAEELYKLKNVEFVSNPALVSLDGINVLMYHGRSFDDLAMSVKGLSHQNSDLIMKELLEKRHLAPIYGERTPLASEFEDHLVIEEIPDIFHTGHVHINSYKRHNGIHMINSGTFQSQTEFQKIYNIMPTYGDVPVIHKGSYKLLKFA